MNNKEKIDRKFKENPVKKAGFPSRMTFWWLRHTFSTGYKRPLKETDAFECLEEHTSKNLHTLFKRLWEEEKSRRDPSILRVFWRAFGPKVLFWGLVFSIVETLNRVALPQFLGYLLMYFTPNSEISLDDAYLYALGIVVCSAIPVLTFHPFILWIMQTAMKLRVGSCCLIYEKTLRLTKSATIDGLSGRVINLMTNDVGKFDMALAFLHDLWKGPLEVFLLGYFIYRELELAGLLGIGFMLSFIPLQSWIGKKAASYRMKTAKRTDTRVKFMNEIIQGIQVIKMYTWENSFAEMVKKIRRKEVIAIRGGQYVRAALLSLFMVSRVSMFLSIVCYVLMGNTITARKVFISTSYYTILNDSMVHFWPLAIAFCAEGYISTRRVLEFLLISEDKPVPIGDRHLVKGEANGHLPNEIPVKRRTHNPHSKEKKISMLNATGYWTMTEAEANPGVSSANVEVANGELCVIIGPVGSGKTTMLQVILGELTLDSGFIHVDGSISYFCQEPWLFEGSIRQNILFIEDYDEERYQKVIKVCALERDIEMFPYGDETIVGERGVSLSGGQKARVSLARTVYKQADIYLLDDPLSAVDAHVGRHIFDQCIKECLADKICVLVTHQLQYLKDVKHIVLMNDACIEAQGTYDHLKEKKSSIMSLLPDDAPKEADEKKQLLVDSSETKKVVVGKPQEVEEHSETGAVEFKVYKNYFKAVESHFWIISIILLNVAAQFCFSGVDLFVSSWVNWEESLTEVKNTFLDSVKALIQYFYSEEAVDVHRNATSTDDKNAAETRTQFIIFYAALMVVLAIVSVVRSFSFFYVGLRISKNLHDKMFRAITRATVYFFNTNSSGRILNRFSKDIGNVDTMLPGSFLDVILLSLEVLAVMILIIIMNYWLLFPTSVLVIIMYILRKIYISTSRSVKRIESLSRSPMFSHTNATLNGLSTIRAFDATEIVQEEFAKLQDFNSSLVYLSNCTIRAFAFWLDFFCVIYIACVVYSFLLIDPARKGGGSVGLAITQSITLIGMLQWGMRQTAELENYMVSVERIQEYIDLKPEAPMETIDAHKPNKSWPEQGRIMFENLSLKYSEHGETILKNLSFTIESQEKVGIVGRTGAGKSSIIQALFRLAPIEGLIEIDGVDTKKLGLKDLRSKISIIPQDPILFSGTLRSNLDPFNERSDTDIWAALEQVELKNEVKSLTGGLDCKMSDAGSNFSLGQRQLVCLARAILRNNRILILDEATANVDAETDSFIQKTIRTKFSHCTVLTIAHRLHTVMDSDKILVMAAGEMVEYGEPSELLQKQDGTLKRLVEKTGATSAVALSAIADGYSSKRKKDL